MSPSPIVDTTIDAAKDALEAMIAADAAFADVHVGRGGTVDPPRQRERIYVGGYRNWRIDDEYSDVGPDLETYELIVIVQVHLLGASATDVEHAAWRLVRELGRLLDSRRGGDPTVSQTVRSARLAGGLNEQSGSTGENGYACNLPLLIAVSAVI